MIEFEVYTSPLSRKQYSRMDLIDVMSFSRINANRAALTDSDIIVMHQYINGRCDLSHRIWEKIDHVRVKINSVGWKRPHMEYDWNTKKLIIR